MTILDEWTDEQLMALPHIGKTEFINGKIIMAPTGTEHGDISIIIAAALSAFTLSKRLGRVYDSNTGFRMSDGDVLATDVSFVTAKHLKGRQQTYKKFLLVRQIWRLKFYRQEILCEKQN